MMIYAHCPGCASAQVNALQALPLALIMPDEGKWSMTCSRGHVSNFVLQQERFELLSEVAMAALIDGYYRESVNSFMSCLERLLEFFVRLVWRKWEVPQAEITKSWRQVSSQSERQIGLFVATYVAEQKQAPTLLSQKEVEFRNEVVHKGKFPTFVETKQFAQSISEIVVPILAMIDLEYPEAKHRSTLELLASRGVGQIRTGEISTLTCLNTLFSLSREAKPIDIGGEYLRRAAQSHIRPFANLVSSAQDIPPST